MADIFSPTAQLMRGAVSSNYTLVNGFRVPKRISEARQQKHIEDDLFFSPTTELMRGSIVSNHTLVNGLRVPNRISSRKSMANRTTATDMFYSPTAQIMCESVIENHTMVNGLRVPNRISRRHGRTESENTGDLVPSLTTNRVHNHDVYIHKLSRVEVYLKSLATLMNRNQ